MIGVIILSLFANVCLCCNKTLSNRTLTITNATFHYKICFRQCKYTISANNSYYNYTGLCSDVINDTLILYADECSVRYNILIENLCYADGNIILIYLTYPIIGVILAILAKMYSLYHKRKRVDTRLRLATSNDMKLHIVTINNNDNVVINNDGGSDENSSDDIVSGSGSSKSTDT